MPHSSGGGSHSGGSFGGGFSGGSFNSNSNRNNNSRLNRISNNHFYGCRTFVYIHHNRVNYIYSDTNDLKKIKTSKNYIRNCLIIFISLLVACAVGMFFILKPPSKLKNTEQYYNIIEDNINCLENTQQLEETLATFKEKTGITVAIITVYHESWKSNFTSLENYAYDLYVNKFTDETHWLIVYSTPQAINPAFEDWEWEGMQGDNTDAILNFNVLNLFNDSLTLTLTARTMFSITEAFNASFKKLNDNVMKIDLSAYENYDNGIYTYIDKKGIFIALSILFIFFTLGIVVNVKNYKNYSRLQNAIEIPAETTEKPNITSCDYCGGTVIEFVQTKCPNCGANIKKKQP